MADDEIEAQGVDHLEGFKPAAGLLTRYIEPAMIVIMGVIIGGVALALLLPIFTIALFLLQQKLFTPPATDEQSARTLTGRDGDVLSRH